MESAQAQPLTVGQRVEYYSPTHGVWMAAVVITVRDEGVYDLDVKTRARRGNMRIPAPPSSEPGVSSNMPRQRRPSLAFPTVAAQASPVRLASARLAALPGPPGFQSEEAVAVESLPVPVSFRCPITQEIMADPVATHDGHVYDRAAIVQWFQRGHRTSPMTGLSLPSLALVDESPLRRAIEEYILGRPGILRKQLDHLSVLAAAESMEEQLRKVAEDSHREHVRRESVEATLGEAMDKIASEAARADNAEAAYKDMERAWQAALESFEQEGKKAREAEADCKMAVQAQLLAESKLEQEVEITTLLAEAHASKLEAACGLAAQAKLNAEHRLAQEVDRATAAEACREIALQGKLLAENKLKPRWTFFNAAFAFCAPCVLFAAFLQSASPALPLRKRLLQLWLSGFPRLREASVPPA